MEDIGMTLPPLTVKALCGEAAAFAIAESKHAEPSLYGVTDGKAVGTYFEQKFRQYLSDFYGFEHGNSASGIDFPGIGVDMKVTSIKQPQSSCPYRAARQKIFGLGYSLLVFVYDKSDDPTTATGTLQIVHTVYVNKDVTGDFQTTLGLRNILENKGNEDDLIAFMFDKHLPLDEIEAHEIAKGILEQGLRQGYLTISNALQWRLQYGRVVDAAGKIDGILRLS